MDIQSFLASLVEEQIVDTTTRDKIYAHFQHLKAQNAASIAPPVPSNKSNNALLIVIGSIGVLLFGLGIIYIFAHNWDSLPRSVKTLLAFVPVLLAFCASAFALHYRKGNRVWEETAAIGTFLAVGSMLALLLQIYQLPGIESYFYFFWCALAMPVIYLLGSHVGVVFALLLIALNLGSSPYDQSTLFRLPWFGSLVLFTGLIPYYRRLFILQSPNHIYVLQQILLPFVVLLSVVVCAKHAESAIWIILFLTLVNFHLFGTSHLLHQKGQQPTILTILSMVGISLLLGFLLYDESWHFQTLLQNSTDNYAHYFIPLLFLIGCCQLFIFFKKESPSASNSYKWILFFPFPLIVFNLFQEITAIPFQFEMLVVCALVLFFVRKVQTTPTIYAAVSFIALLILSFLFFPNSNFNLFYLSLVPGLFFSVAYYNPKTQNNDGVLGAQIVLLCIQMIYLLIGSFEGFWTNFIYSNADQPDYTHNSTSQLMLICCTLGVVATLHWSNFSKSKTLLGGIPFWTHVGTPLVLLVGCFNLFPIHYFITIFLLASGIVGVIYGAKKTHLAITNLSMGLIGIVLLCRFFDVKMSLTLKGIIFILIGLSFFFANYKIMTAKKDKS